MRRPRLPWFRVWQDLLFSCLQSVEPGVESFPVSHTTRFKRGVRSVTEIQTVVSSETQEFFVKMEQGGTSDDEEESLSTDRLALPSSVCHFYQKLKTGWQGFSLNTHFPKSCFCWSGSGWVMSWTHVPQDDCVSEAYFRNREWNNFSFFNWLSLFHIYYSHKISLKSCLKHLFF